MTRGHEMQHPDAPTWCIHCGTFDVYATGECRGERDGAFDSRLHGERMARELFGWD